MAIRRFHFDLSHLPPSVPALRLHVGVHRYPMSLHSADTRAAAIRDNAALALLSAEQRGHITHYADVDESHLPERQLRRLKVTFDQGNALPALVLMWFYLPLAARQRHRERKFKNSGSRRHPKLAQYGVGLIDGAALVRVYDAADDITTPMDAAKAIIFHHPGLATRDVTTATRIMDDHIESPDNLAALNNLATAISKQGTAGWATITPSVDQNGTPLTYGYDFGPHKAGDPVMQYKLSDATQAAVPAGLTQPLKTTADDAKLQGQTWSVTQGIAAEHQPSAAFTSGAAHARRRSRGIAADAPAFKWTVLNQTGNNGISVDMSSIQFDGTTFQIGATNNQLRTMAAYVQFQNENGDSIENPDGWQENLSSDLQKLFETDDSKKYIRSVSAVNTIMGIPMPTDPTTLSFPFPEDATTARLLFGGLGSSNWDGDVCPAGALLTGIFQYGIPMLFIAAGAAVTSTKWFNDFVSDNEKIALVLAAAFPLVGGGVTVGAALLNTKKVLITFSDIIAGLLFSIALQKLQTYVATQIAEQEVEDEVPFVGWGLRLVGLLATWEEIACTTAAILSSPAELEFHVTRAFDLQLTLHPDPAHGEPGRPETAVWPAVGDHYLITVQYKGGTNFVQTGAMPTTTSSTPLSLTFTDLPAGGQIQIIAGIYSASGWVCGKWQSDWMDATPTDGTTLSVDGSITEQLVPLTSDTQYNYKEKIVFDVPTSRHKWQAGDPPPTATVASLDSSNIGPAYGAPVDLTIFEKTFEIAYAWQAAPLALPLAGNGNTPYTGQAYTFQNLSVLADPESRLKTPTATFAAQPYIVYDQYGPQPNGSAPSPYAFLVDPRNGQYHLRYVPIDDGNAAYDVNDPNLQSWGQFPLAHMDAIVIHPSGYAIGASWSDQKIATLKIPDAPSADADAPMANLVSGEGIRQGLVNGPIAMTVTPDGRLLVLESLNERVQAFDCNGNPVASFDGAAPLFIVPAAGYATDLDNATCSDALQAQFRQCRAIWKFDLDPSLSAMLDQGSVTQALLDAFSAEGVTLSYDATTPSASTAITVITAGQAWQIVDSGKSRSYTVTAASVGGVLSVFDDLTRVTVTVRAPGQQWIIADLNDSRSWDVRTSDTTGFLDVYDFLPTLPLVSVDGQKELTYLDIASESKGYIYVLSYTGGGADASDYVLDIYAPNGDFVCRTPDARLTQTPQNVAAARLAVDIWRNLFTLNYEKIVLPNGRTEPTIGHWIPSPPLFQLDLSDQPSFDSGDVDAVRTLFSQNNTPLPAATTVTRVSTAGLWSVHPDGWKGAYDVIRSGSALYVYAVATPTSVR